MSVDNLIVELPLFQEESGGAIPTSTHQLFFKQINYETAMKVAKQNHYLHRQAPTSYSFGAFFSGVLLGICNFGVPASHHLTIGVCGKERKDDVLELNRLWLDDVCPKNSESRFIAWCLKQLPPNTIVVSYADTGYDHIGVVYKATNWLYTGLSAKRTDVKVEGGLHPRAYDKNLVYAERQERSRKHRYIYFRNPDDRKLLKYPIQPYPQ